MAATAMRELRNRVAFVLVDGIGDVTISSLTGRMPLEVAATLRLDAVAATGMVGLMDLVEPGLACGSDMAHLFLLGYDLRRRVAEDWPGPESVNARVLVQKRKTVFSCCVGVFVGIRAMLLGRSKRHSLSLCVMVSSRLSMAAGS
ncbi:hypothetical protein ABZP36_012758 [Zizania latifolia]